eukprot:symbB.v1.2.010462.t4/scaffold669.1/size295035/13
MEGTCGFSRSFCTLCDSFDGIALYHLLESTKKSSLPTESDKEASSDDVAANIIAAWKGLEFALTALQKWSNRYLERNAKVRWMLAPMQWLAARTRQLSLKLDSDSDLRRSRERVVEVLRQIFTKLQRDKDRREGALVISCELLRLYSNLGQASQCAFVLTSVGTAYSGNTCDPVKLPKSLLVTLYFLWGKHLVMAGKVEEAEEKLSKALSMSCGFNSAGKSKTTEEIDKLAQTTNFYAAGSRFHHPKKVTKNCQAVYPRVSGSEFGVRNLVSVSVWPQMPLLRSRSLSPDGTEIQDSNHEDLKHQRWWEESVLYSEKSWKNGWSLDGYPYVASTSQFLKLPTGSDGSAGGKNPSWAPRFPYPQALQRVKPETSSLGAGAQSGESVDMVMAQVQGGLPEGVTLALDSLEAAFSNGDPGALLSALQELASTGTCQELKQDDFARRAGELLAASSGEKLKRENGKMGVLEREIWKRFSRALAKQPERTKEFVQNGLPEPMLAMLQRHRMTRVVREMTSKSSSSTDSTSLDKGSHVKRGEEHRSLRPSPMRDTTLSMPPYPMPSKVPTKAVTPYQLSSKNEAELSQAVLELPWSGNEQWERRWEQEVIWHPGIMYAAHQALPQQR